MDEDRSGLIVERTVAILTQIALKVATAAVLDRQVKPAEGTGNSVTPANLLEQVRCDRSRPKHI